MLSVNPFNSPEVKKQILESSGVQPIEDPDVIEESPDLSDFQNIIQATPILPGKQDKALKTIIRDASAVVRDDNAERSKQMDTALADVMTKYNEEYGLNLHYDFSNVAKTLVACADERSSKILELYVSKICKSIRPVLILGMLSKLSLALETIMAPENLLDRSQLSLTDLFLSCDMILGYISKLESIMESITLDNEGLELKRLAEENGMEYKESDSELVENFMALFKSENGLN